MCGVGILSDWMYECTSDVQQKFEFSKKNFLNKFEHTAAVNCKILSIASSVINWIYNVDIYNIDTWLTNHLIIWLQQVVTSSGWSFWSDFYEQVISRLFQSPKGMMSFITSAEAEVVWSVLFVCHCVSFCEQDYCKSYQPISRKLDVMIGPTNRKNLSTFGDDPAPKYGFWTTFPLPFLTVTE